MKSKRTHSISTVELENIIKTRLSYQSTQRGLENKLGIKSFDFNKLKTPSFLKIYSMWDELKRREFLFHLGGPANRDFCARYMENLISPPSK